MKKGLMLLMLVLVSITAFAQPLERAGWITIGISPCFLLEPYDEHANTVEINVLPLTVEIGLSDAWAIEFRPIINLRFKPKEPVSISHLGISVILPRYVPLPWLENSDIAGLIGPVTTLTYNLQDRTTTLTLAGEIGASVPFSAPWVLDTQLQAGATFFWEEGGTFSQTVPHIGLFVIPGVRLPGK
jgi:hypothetical protein